jgi:uncharacterized protein (DUF486 family)
MWQNFAIQNEKTKPEASKTNQPARSGADRQSRGKEPMSVILRTISLLTASNVFMTFAWYAHLKNLSDRPWYIAALTSWGIALFEYMFQVPANRIGYTQLSISQLKIMQEAITLSVFVPFALLYIGEPFKLDYVWAGLCLLGAVYFIFRS